MRYIDRYAFFNPVNVSLRLNESSDSCVISGAEARVSSSRPHGYRPVAAVPVCGANHTHDGGHVPRQLETADVRPYSVSNIRFMASSSLLTF